MIFVHRSLSVDDVHNTFAIAFLLLFSITFIFFRSSFQFSGHVCVCLCVCQNCNNAIRCNSVELSWVEHRLKSITEKNWIYFLSRKKQTFLFILTDFNSNFFSFHSTFRYWIGPFASIFSLSFIIRTKHYQSLWVDKFLLFLLLFFFCNSIKWSKWIQSIFQLIQWMALRSR